MDHDAFIGKVQQRADLASRGEADSATRAVLSTLGERITEREAEDLESQLPMEVGRYLTDDVEHAQQFDFEAFADRVAEKAQAADVEDDPRGTSQAVASVVAEATTEGEFRDIVNQFPKNEAYGGLLTGVEEADSSET